MWVRVRLTQCAFTGKKQPDNNVDKACETQASIYYACVKSIADSFIHEIKNVRNIFFQPKYNAFFRNTLKIPT